jgi:glutamyl-tRNA synthetase
VLRAQEHLNNTPRHVALQRALGFRTPLYAHMPLIFNMDGSKMSKRDKDKAVRAAVKQRGIKELPREIAEKLFKAGTPASLFTSEQFVEWLGDSDRQLPPAVMRVIAQHLKVVVPEVEVSDFREAGYLPEAIVNFLGLLGWSPGKDEQGKDVEKFGREFIAKHFSLERIGRGNAKFDRVKLGSFNQDYLRALPDEEFERRWCAWCEEQAPELMELDAGRFAMLARAVKPRAKTFADAAAMSRWSVIKDEEIEFDQKAVDKVLKKGTPSGLEVLREVRPALAGIEPFSAEAVQGAVDAFCTRRDLNVGLVAQPLRVAVTGSAVSPPLGETLAVLGRERVLARIDRCLCACG